jgi:uncharacterized coiled-coil protein SlyX
MSAAKKVDEETKFTNNYDTVNIEVEAEARVKAVRLRMQGQLQTIKTLEKQLSEALEMLTARNKQLAHVHARLKAIEPKFSAAANSALVSKRMQAEEARSVGVAEENAAKFKAQADILQGKLLDEQTRRQRVEERARVMKEYADKAKLQCSSLESANAEHSAQVVELNSRTQKYRKGYKDIAADAAAHKNTVGERETELMRQQAKTERVESKLRSVSRVRLRTVRLFC